MSYINPEIAETVQRIRSVGVVDQDFWLKVQFVPQQIRVPESLGRRRDVVVVQIREDCVTCRIRGTGSRSRWGEWFPYGECVARIQQTLEVRKEYDARGRKKVRRERVKQATSYGEWLLEQYDVELSRIRGWLLVELRRGELLWKGYIRFAALKEKRKLRRWSDERLKKLYAAGLTAWTIRVDEEMNRIRFEYSAEGKKCSYCSPWVESGRLLEGLLAESVRAASLGWRDKEVFILQQQERRVVARQDRKVAREQLKIRIEQELR